MDLPGPDQQLMKVTVSEGLCWFMQAENLAWLKNLDNQRCQSSLETFLKWQLLQSKGTWKSFHSTSSSVQSLTTWTNNECTYTLHFIFNTYQKEGMHPVSQYAKGIENIIWVWKHRWNKLKKWYNFMIYLCLFTVYLCLVSISFTCIKLVGNKFQSPIMFWLYSLWLHISLLPLTLQENWIMAKVD